MEYITINIKCQALRKSFGLIDHYFLEIGENEFHLGFYRKGKILPRGSTKGSHLAVIRKICLSCYERLKIMLEYAEDVRLFDYYPLVNCETLTTGISVQLGLTMCAFPFLAYFCYTKNYTYLMILFLLMLLCVLIHSKYVYSRTVFSHCSHLKLKQE